MGGLLVKDLDIETIVIPCARCGEPHVGKVHGAFNQGDHEGPPEGRLFVLASCPGCNCPYLLYLDWGWVAHELLSTKTPVLVYPGAGDAIDESVPTTIAESFAQTLKTAHAGVPVATAMMCRRTLECICNHLGTKGFMLGEKLKDLKNKIDPRLHEWADQVLKEMGNDAAHIKEDIDPEDAQDAVEFTRALINNIFVLQSAFEEFKKRREKRRESKELIQGAVQRMVAEGKPSP